MELANVKGWNYFFLVITINPRSANTFISRGKKESSASLDKKCLNPHFLERFFFFLSYYMTGKSMKEKGYQGNEPVLKNFREVINIIRASF